MTAPTEAEERAAREWLACARNLRIKPGSLSVYSELDDREHRAVILRLLDRPVLPPEPSDEMLQVMQQAWLSTSMAEDASSAIYRALYAHLTRPRTKTVWSASYVLRDVNAKGTPTPYEITGRGSLGEILTDLSIIKRNWPGQVVDVKITHREVPL